MWLQNKKTWESKSSSMSNKQELLKSQLPGKREPKGHPLPDLTDLAFDVKHQNDRAEDKHSRATSSWTNQQRLMTALERGSTGLTWPKCPQNLDSDKARVTFSLVPDLSRDHFDSRRVLQDWDGNSSQAFCYRICQQLQEILTQFFQRLEPYSFSLFPHPMIFFQFPTVHSPFWVSSVMYCDGNIVDLCFADVRFFLKLYMYCIATSRTQWSQNLWHSILQASYEMLVQHNKTFLSFLNEHQRSQTQTYLTFKTHAFATIAWKGQRFLKDHRNISLITEEIFFSFKMLVQFSSC